MIRFLAVCFSLALAVLPASAQFAVSGGPALQTNIYDLYAGQNAAGTISPGVGSASVPIGTRTLRSTTLVNGETTLITVIFGDSISANSGPSPVVPTQTNNQNFDPYGGNVYDYKDPVIGASDGPGSMWSLLNDRLRSTGRYQRVITFDMAIGGTTSGDWSSSGSFGHRARAACLWARALGWPVSGSGNGGNWKLVFLYMLGTNDAAQGTTGPQFTARALSTFAMLAAQGCTAKILICTCTMLSNAVNAALQTAQAGLVDGVTRFAGPNLDSLTGGTNRQADGTHLTLTGETNAAPLTDSALQAAGL